MEDMIINSLKQKGHVVSAKREIIIREVCKAGEISDVELFWLELRRQYTISWATVYTNIRLLIKVGVLQRKPSAKTYSVRLNKHLSDPVEI